MEKIVSILNTDEIKVLIIVLVLDLILGILRAIKERSLNSCIGIDGMIRKVAMIVVIIFLSGIDHVIHLNLIGFIPEAIRTILNLREVGISSLFNMLFIIFETLSIFKNMILCKLPIPKKFQEYLEKIMKEFTGEIREKEGDTNAKK